MDLDEERDNLKKNLLPRDRIGSDEQPPEFQSCRSKEGNEDAKDINDIARLDKASSINYEDKPPSSCEDEKVDDTRGALNQEEQKSKKDPSQKSERYNSITLQRSHTKLKPKSLMREILDLLVFCYEFLMVGAVITTSAFLPSIPCSIYVFLSITYIGLSIILKVKKTNLTIGILLMGIQLTVACVFLIFKIIFSILIKEKNITYHRKLYMSLGIAIQPGDADAWDVTRTFLSDICSLVVSLLLFIGCIIKSKRSSDELDDQRIENLKVTGSRSPSFWICISMAVIGLAGIISPSLIALSFAILVAIGLSSWAMYFHIQGTAIDIITYCSLVVAALLINISFIIQIEFFENIQSEWLDYVGLDNFDSTNPKFVENVLGYAATVLVYIVCLIYRKAASRYIARRKYMQKYNPGKLYKEDNAKKNKGRRRKKQSGWETFNQQTAYWLKNPYLHLMIVRFLCFGWIFLYFCFQSLVVLLLLCHSLIYQRDEIFFKIFKYAYLPIVWVIFIFNYVINIETLFNDDLYKEENWRFGIFDYNPAFPHLLYQLFTLFYFCFTIYLYRVHNEEKAESRDRDLKKAQTRSNRIMSGGSYLHKVSSKSILEESAYDQTETSGPYTYEIAFRYILKNIDILLMVVLYLGGVNRIDVYHMILLVLFAIYIMYPDQFRRKFIFLLYFMIFIASIKYLYVLFLPEFEKHTKLNDLFIILGFSTDIEGTKYGTSNLLTYNYLIVLTGFLQYRLYTSDYSKSAFSETQLEEDKNTFGSRFPRLSQWLNVVIELVQLSIPWITYIVFLTIAVVNRKSIISWVLLTMTLILLFWHLSADLITPKSHVRLTRGWWLFTFVSAVCFLIIITFQILCMDQIAHSKIANDFLDWLPDFIIKNHSIIGLNDYTDLGMGHRAAKFLAYVAYFNLSVITRRQFIRSSQNVQDYQTDTSVLNNASDVPSHSEEVEEQKQELNEVKEDIIEVKFSLVFIIYKLKQIWSLFDIIA